MCNTGSLDRALRVILGMAIILVGHYYQSYLGFIGFIPLLTGLSGVCLAYFPLKINTCKK